MNPLHVPPWLKAWIRTHDTGTSSMTIAHALLLGTLDLLDRMSADAPRDTSDVGRCVRLLDAAAAGGEDWRSRLGEVAALCPAWKPLVPRWTEIEAAYHEDVKAQDSERRKNRTALDKARAACPDPQNCNGSCEDKVPRITYPPSRCWWLVATLRKDGHDPYEKSNPHPFKPAPEPA